VLVELRKSFTNYGPNKRRSCNWIVSHLRITEFYAKQTAPQDPNPFYTESSMVKPSSNMELRVPPSIDQLFEVIRVMNH